VPASGVCYEVGTVGSGLFTSADRFTIIAESTVLADMVLAFDSLAVLQRPNNLGLP
jgi:hypothetical protein